MESMIKQTLVQVEQDKDELKKMKSMLQDIYNSDATYCLHEKASKESAKVLKATKAEIDKRPQVADLKIKIKELSNSSKETQLSLFDYAAEYSKMAGVNEIEDTNGEMYDIITTAKLVKKAQM